MGRRALKLGELRKCFLDYLVEFFSLERNWFSDGSAKAMEFSVLVERDSLGRMQSISCDEQTDYSDTHLIFQTVNRLRRGLGHEVE